MNRNTYLILGSFIVATGFAIQFGQIATLKKEVAALRGSSSQPTATEPNSNPAKLTLQTSGEETKSLQTRIAQIERSLASLAKGPRGEIGRGMENGGLVSEEELARMHAVFLDGTASENERVKALRLLRRNNKVDDQTLAQAMGMFQTSTNANIRREVLQSLEGVTNAALKEPLMALLSDQSADAGLRGQLVNMLRPFEADPAVEQKLWDLALNDPNTRLRNEASEALTHAPVTPERIEQLRTKTANTEASLDERLISFRALRLAKSETPEVISQLATMAENSTDPITRAKLFKSFNGLTDPNLMLPLVNGLQDVDPVVRQNAANALSEFPDPRVQEWLTHLIQNDADPAVKREAHNALERTMRLSRGTR